MFPSRTNLLLPLMGTALALLAAPAARSCGPFLPNCYLGASYADQSSLPTLGFDAELQRILTPAEAFLRQHESVAQEDHAEARSELAEAQVYLPALTSYDRENPPAALPLEFHLYAIGASAWHHGEFHTAADAWRRLLGLPTEQRHYRSVWAAYMLGRIAAGSAPSEAEPFWSQARDLASAGFADSRHLAVASLGDSALLALHHGNVGGALDLYWRQYTLGGHSARSSLQFTLRQIFLDSKEPEPNSLEGFAYDPARRRIITAWFLARGGPYQPWSAREESRFKTWMVAVSRKSSMPAEESDRWAWAAYAAGEWDAAQRFADAAPADAPASEWVRALLLLRRGSLEQAAVHLANAARAFEWDASNPPLLGEAGQDQSDYADGSDFAAVDPKSKLAGIRGCLALSRDQYLEALRLFRAAHHEVDASYVAEKVLTLAELRTFVDSEAPDDSGLRSLLARRLARAGRFAEARPYYPDDVRGAFETYVQAAQSGYNAHQSKAIRAAGFWTAAQVLQVHGMELLGTEHEPDFGSSGGSFEWPSLAAGRIEHPCGHAWYFAPGAPHIVPEPLAASYDEVKRYEASKTPGHRYHYRYRAAELAMLAADLSPDDDATTAAILAAAGNWLAPRDPDSAQIFYKTLVIRCPNTDLGRKAAAAHWLPKI